jgi:predicted AlkP superfamily pyrophosphatase or phosphodiesterase
MLRGVDVSRHGITTNTFHPLVRPLPSIIDQANAHGLKVGFFYNWGPLRDLHDPESVAISYYLRSHNHPTRDNRISAALIKFNNQDNLDFAVLYMGYVDECGHANGWMSKPYLDAVGNADSCLSNVVESCHPTHILVLSDHGGHERTHGTELREDMTIPWLVWGRGIRQNHPIECPVRIFDTAPTLAAILGIKAAQQWDGTVIAEVFTR